MHFATSLLFALLALAACGTDREALEGRFVADDGSGVLTFSDDGTVAFEHQGRTFVGTYEKTEEQHVQVRLPGAHPITLFVEDAATLRGLAPTGGPVIYRRDGERPERETLDGPTLQA